MALLRRVLYWMAAAWAACGLAVAIAPRWVLVSLFDQRPFPDYTFVRATGVMSVGLAMLMVLVAQHLDDIWWFSWTFALVGAALATISALNALFGVPAGASVLLWWIFAGVNAAFTAGVLAGMGQAGQEKPFV
jgi:hypothetical protein